MQGQRGRNERRAGVFLDVAHLILGLAIVIFAGHSNDDRDRSVGWFPASVPLVDLGFAPIC